MKTYHFVLQVDFSVHIEGESSFIFKGEVVTTKLDGYVVIWPILLTLFLQKHMHVYRKSRAFVASTFVKVHFIIYV